ncbi:MAG: hypothetical protein B6226_03740, partial [Candidatus Cloacimonetes bacterium 4572_65]
MKKIILFIVLVVSMITTIACQEKSVTDEKVAKTDIKTEVKAEAKTAETELVWLENYEEALQLASKENKLVLIDFTGSDWCIWCKRLKAEVFTQEAFKKYAAENLVLLELDFPSTFKDLPQEVQAERRSLATKYEIKGYPTILLTDASGKVVARTGYQDGGPEK